MSPPENRLPNLDTSSSADAETLPITSFACKWKAPRKRKESNAKMSDVSFTKHVYGRTVKHDLKSLNEYDPRPMEYRGKAQGRLPGFLSKVKGKGLGVSVLFDPEGRVWKLDDEAKATLSDLPSKDVLVKRVAAFKESLKLTPERIRAMERSTVDQSQSPIWYSARRYRLTASTFGRIFHMLPSTPPDCLVKQLLHPQNFSTKATEWGKHHEAIAFDKYVEHQVRNGHTGLVAAKSGFVVCEEYPYLGASPDGCIHDPGSVDQYGLLEIKCPYKYRDKLPEDAAAQSDFCCSTSKEAGVDVLKLKRGHVYYSQIQGQLAITERKWCDFVVFTNKGISVERIKFDPDHWQKLLSKLTEFYDNCFCPAIVYPVHLVGIKMLNLSKM